MFVNAKVEGHAVSGGDIKKPKKLICSKKDEWGGLRGLGHQRDWEGLLQADGPEFEVKLLFMLLVPVR